MSDGPPQIPAEIAQQIAWHRDKVRICELEFQIGELQLQLADERAARRSLELTLEREQLAAMLNTSEWRFDFDRYEYVRRTAPVAQPRELVYAEAIFDGAHVTMQANPDHAGRIVQVRVRYDLTDAEAFEARGRQLVRDTFTAAEKVIIAPVAVTGLKDERHG